MVPNSQKLASPLFLKYVPWSIFTFSTAKLLFDWQVIETLTTRVFSEICISGFGILLSEMKASSDGHPRDGWYVQTHDSPSRDVHKKRDMTCPAYQACSLA